MSGSLNGLQRRPAVLFIVVLVVIAVIGALFFMGKGKPNPLLDKVSDGHHPELDQKLNSLAVNLDVAHFDGVLGNPAIAADKVIKIATVEVKRHARPKQIIEEIKYREYFYIHEDFYVQVIADEAGKVGLYSITARDKRYLPNITTATAETVRLGRSVYGDLSNPPIKVAGLLNPNRENTFYYEIYPATSAEGGFVVFASNTNGYLDKVAQLDEKTSGLLISRFGPDAEGFPIHAMHGEFREATTINTYTFVAAWLKGFDMTTTGANYGTALINFGPRADQLTVAQ